MAQAETLIAPRAERARTTAHLRVWLLTVAALVFLMVSVGGATRLTGSGLSITEWQPIMGALPPLSEADWQEAFAKYRQIPQYHHVNRGMSLEAFKFIFWWEWTHRFLGRLIGVVFLVPFLVFLAAGAGAAQRSQGSSPASSSLGGLQGFDRLVHGALGPGRPHRVSQYRLALHLGLAILIFGALVWVALSLDEPRGGRSAGAGSRRQRAGVAARAPSPASCSCRSCSARSSRG